MGKKKNTKNKNNKPQSSPIKTAEEKLSDTALRSDSDNINAAADEIKNEVKAEVKGEKSSEKAFEATKKTKNNTAKETTGKAENNTAKESADKAENNTEKETADKAEKNTAKETAGKAEKNTAKESADKAENNTAKESADKAENNEASRESTLQKIASFKEFFKKLWKKYKAWLYSEPKEKKREHGAPSVAVALILPVLIFLFGLYYVGILDIAFIPRPASWETNFDRFFSIGKVTEPEKETTDENESPEEQTAETGIEKVPSVDLGGTVIFDREEQKINYNTVFKTDDELIAEGYYITDGTYDSSTCEVGKMTYDFTLPERFTYRNMKVRDWVITEYDDGRMSTVEETETTVRRPAVYPYMGYIILDDARNGLYLLDYTGNILMNYNENYIPAFARTAEGDPLFYSTYRYYAETPVSVEENEAGEEVVTDAKGVYLTGKNYFTLSASGTSFVKAEYVEEKDGRGLNFDFEDSYGLADTKIKRVGVMSPKFTTFLDGKSALVNFMNWNFFLEDDPNIPWLEDIVAKESAYNALTVEEKLKLIEAGQTPADLYALDEKLPYSAAYNYSGGYAVVVTDDTGEDPKYETKEVRVINSYGEVQFVSRKEYYNTELKDYCSDRFLLPLSKGDDSIGHLYFDHGLLRLRKVTFDQFQLDEYGVLRVNIDRDVLVYPNGTEFPIPNGFTLKGYSDGIMVLERNGLYGYMDYTGRWIAEPEYDMAEPFYSGVGVVTKNGQSAALDTNGKYVLPFKFSHISNRSDGIIAAYSEANGWEVYGIFTK